ncbi:hypothetical protein BPIT_07060 [Candidatus Brocadia pituitae]|nr:hypothetical protein BPIT_07060 [Candidatus Brocadia pituitae]
MMNKLSGFLHHSFAVSAAVRHKTGNFDSLDTVRDTPTLGVPESVSAKTNQCLCWGASKIRPFILDKLFRKDL